MISPKDIRDYNEAAATIRERHPEWTSEDAEHAFDDQSPEVKLKCEEICNALPGQILRKFAIANMIREAITTVEVTVGAGTLAYLFLGHPRWMVIAVCALGFGAYHTGLLYRIGLRENTNQPNRKED